MSHTLKVLLAALTLCTLLFAGCSNSPGASPPTPVSAFASTVSEADAAMESGDAQRAFDLYTEALKMPDASDIDGSIAERQNLAKHTYIARLLLAKPIGGYDMTPLTAIVIDHSIAETETVEAKKRIVGFLRKHGKTMRADIPVLRKDIEAEEPYRLPTSVVVLPEMGDLWARDLSTLEGEYGTTVRAAIKLLTRASIEASAVGDERWVDEAVKHLNKALKTLDEFDKALNAVR